MLQVTISTVARRLLHNLAHRQGVSHADVEEGRDFLSGPGGQQSKAVVGAGMNEENDKGIYDSVVINAMEVTNHAKLQTDKGLARQTDSARLYDYSRLYLEIYLIKISFI
jgi:hypothetical protein